jgi:small subunit ribosomal protein S15
MSISKQQKEEIIKKFGASDKDTGSLEVQIAILTADIEVLKPHFEKNKKDNHSKRGFIAKIQRRKKYLAHLRETNFESYAKLIAELGLRK